MDDAGLADFLVLVAAFGFADAGLRFLDTRDNLGVAAFVDFEAVDFAGGEVDFEVPEVAASATGEDDVGGEEFVAHVVVPEAVDPDDVVATVVGKAHILTAVHAHVLVNDGAHALLVVVVAVDVGDTFLQKIFGFGNLFVGGGEAAILTFDGEVDGDILMEGPAVVVVAPNLGGFPFFDRFYILLGAGKSGEQRDSKSQKELLHHSFGCYFSVAKILIFRHVCKFFFQIAKKVVFLQFEIINATRIKIV